MQLDAILEVAIGLVFAWLVLSVTASEIQEWIKGALNVRAAHLQKSIVEMFKNEQALVDKFYSHPAIMDLSTVDKNGKPKKPDYIPNDVFAEVSMEILLNARKQASAAASEAVSFGIGDGGTGTTVDAGVLELTNRLFPIPSTAGTGDAVSFGLDFNEMRDQFEDKVDQYRKNAERWFNHVMTKSSDLYKKNAQIWAFWVGLVLAFFFNVDSIHIAKQLWREPTMREALAAQASAYNPSDPNATAVSVDSFNRLALPVGWGTVPAEDESVCNQMITADGRFTSLAGGECHVRVNVPIANSWSSWFTKIFGVLITAFAARQGAPFWFDILRKLVNAKSQASPAKEEQPAG